MIVSHKRQPVTEDGQCNDCSCLHTQKYGVPGIVLVDFLWRMGEERGLYKVLVGKPEGRRPLGRPRRRWVDNIRMDLQEVGCGYMDWIGQSFSRRTLHHGVSK